MDQSLLAKPIYKGFDAIVGSDYQFKSLGQVLPIAKDGWRILVVGTTRESSKLTIKANGLHITGVSNIGGVPVRDMNQQHHVDQDGYDAEEHMKEIEARKKFITDRMLS